ncbi:MAG: HDIG domain-containing protein [Acidobacteria bacterium]|nr:HDIG domain-containing protein [Acidobacteriota bacterium]
MVEKLKSKPESVFKKKSFLEKKVEQFKTRVITNDTVWAVTTVLLLLIFMGPEIIRTPYQYKLGDIAQSTIKVPTDITVADDSGIEQRRLDAVEKTLLIYDKIPDSGDLVKKSISRFFEKGRAILSGFMREKNITSYQDLAQSSRFKTAREQIINRLKDSFEINADTELVKFLISINFNKPFEESSLILADRLSKYDILKSREEIENLSGRGFLLRRLGSNNEEIKTERIEDLSGYRSMDDIPSILYRESLSLNLDTMAKLYARRFVGLEIKPNIEFNSSRTEEARARAVLDVEPVYYSLKKGEVIVREGDIIDETDLIKIFGLQQQSRKLNFYLNLVGLFIILVCFIVAIRKYTEFFLKRYLKVANLFILLSSILILQVALMKFSLFISESMVDHFLLSPLNKIESYYYMIPFAAGAMLLTSLVNQQIAIILAVAVSIFSGLMTAGNFYVGFFALCSSLAAIYGIRHYRERAAILKAAMIVSLVNIIFVAAINLFMVKVEAVVFLFEIFAAFIGGFVVAFFVQFLLPILESAFGIATDIKLLELSSMDRELLRRLSVETPGTYQHSVMVGMLAEAAANEIAANPLFCRVATLYHDVGKLLKPDYFVENNSGAPKLHRKQKPNMSALILVNHVKKGIQIARDNKIPQSIIDIIPQHHGTRLISNFYEQAKELADPDIDEVKEDDFRYPGPKPQTKEAAIIMVADSIEAASRTLKNPSPQKIRGMVDEIINNIFMDGQFDECQLTMIDLRKISDAISRKLTTIFHGRVEYPQFQFNRPEESKSENVKDKDSTAKNEKE